MTNIPTNLTLVDFCSKRSFASHPDNPLNSSEFEYLFKNRDANGFKEAFVKVTTRNFLVHIPTFSKCLADRRGM